MINPLNSEPEVNLVGGTIKLPSILDRTMLSYLEGLTDSRREGVLRFYDDHKELIHSSRGSKSKHQAWEGGYADHLAEIFRIADLNYQSYSALRPLPFTFDSAIIVLKFHDAEKIWAYTVGLPADFNKDTFYDRTLKEKYNIVFSEEERNALHYVHGESDKDYDPHVRKAGRLAAFCHVADHLSARLWFDEGEGLGA